MTKPVTRKLAVDCLLYRSDTMGGIWCGVCDEKCYPGQDIQFDHIHADKLGGQHEYQNLRPVHTECHKRKSKKDVGALAKIDRITGKTKNKPKAKIKSRPFQKRIKKDGRS